MDGPRQDGARIRQERQRRGWKTNHLARLADCRPNTLSHLEGERVVASIELLHRVAAALGVPYEALLSEAGRAEWSALTDSLAATPSDSPAAGSRPGSVPAPVEAPRTPGAGTSADEAVA